MNEPLTPENAVLTDEQFKEHVKKHREMTETMLKDPSEHFSPSLTVIVRQEDGTEELTMCFLHVPFNEAEEKHKALFTVGTKFYDEQKIVIGVVLSSEAWVSRQDKKDYEREPVMPRDDPNKTEAVIVAGSGARHDQKHVIAIPIKRDDKNMMLIDGGQEVYDSGEVEFPLLEWFWRGYFSKLTGAQ